MNIISFSRPFLVGVLHSFDPDHVTAVSVLAAESALSKRKKTWNFVFRSSQWALGHSVTLLIFGMIALIFKSSLQIFVEDISFWAEVAVGPIMILLGIQAIKRNHKINELLVEHKRIEAHNHLNNALHLHGKAGEEIAFNPLTRSFWVGMLHGLAGTGGILTSALILSAETLAQSVMVLVFESLGIIIAMGTYSYILVFSMSRFLEKNLSAFKWINGIAGLLSILIGSYWIYGVVMETWFLY